MERLKPLFISAYVALITILALYSLYEMALGVPPRVLWLGVAISAIAPVLFFIWIFVAKPSGTADHPMVVTLITAIGVVTSMVVAYRYPNLDSLGLFMAFVVFIGWIIYVRWYSRFKNRYPGKLAPGLKLPEFSLLDLEDNLVSSVTFRNKPHVLIFYRGNWCPFCQAQARDVARAYDELAKLGAEVIMISPQPEFYSRRLAQKLDAPIRFLTDLNNDAAGQLGIAAIQGVPLGLQLLGFKTSTTLPTAIITDAKGTILFIDLTENYRIRPDTATFVEILEEIAKPQPV